MSNPVLKFEGLSKMFVSGSADSFTALQGVDLTIQEGEFVALLGPSGCGKSTLLNMAAGLMKPSSGTVTYRGEPVTRPNVDVGYMTQKDSVLPWRTAAGNVSLPLEIHRVARRERAHQVAQMLERVGLAGAANKFPAELSGGMRKRVLLARSLVYRPRTLLMDEPFGALDAQLRASLQQDLVELWSRDGCTILFVTHDIEEAILLADRVIVFGTNPGRVVYEETLPFSRPRDMKSIRENPAAMATWSRLWDLLHSNGPKKDAETQA